MKVEFTVAEKIFTSDKGEAIKYYVLSKELFNGEIFEIPIKGDKAKLLMLNIAAESKNK